MAKTSGLLHSYQSTIIERGFLLVLFFSFLQDCNSNNNDYVLNLHYGK